MIADELSEFTQGAALQVNSLGRFSIGDVIDLGEHSPSARADLYLVITVLEDVESNGAATVAYELVSDGQDVLATDGTATLHFSSGQLPIAQLPAGRAIIVSLPPGTYERYLGLIHKIAGATLTGGFVNAFLTPDPARWRAYAHAST